jgi:hypothetical protein
MLAAVDLDDEERFDRGEVDDIGTHRLLATEFHVLDLPVAQISPKPLLGLCRLPPEPASLLRSYWRQLVAPVACRDAGNFRLSQQKRSDVALQNSRR